MSTSHTGAPQAAGRGVRHTMLSIAPLNVAVQAASFVSSLALAHVLGATAETDAYYLALSIPALTYGLLLNALRSGAAPALSEVHATKGVGALSEVAGELFSGVVAACAVLTLVMTAVVELALPLFTDGRLLSETRVAVLELAVYGVFGAATGVLTAVLAGCHVYVIPVAALLLEPVIKTVLTISLGSEIGIQSLILGNLLGGAASVLLLLWALGRRGVSLRLLKPRLTPFVRGVIGLSAPLLVGSSILLVNPVIDRSMASDVGPGSITALELGLRLLAPMALMTSFLSAPLTAEWSARRAAEGREQMLASAARAVGAVTLVFTPALVLGVVLRNELVLVLFKGGAYPASALDKTAAVFAMIVLSLPASFLITVLGVLFLVERDPMFLLQNACANVVLNVVLNLALRPFFGVAGIALSTTLTLTVLLARIVFTARRRWGLFGDRGWMHMIGRAIVSAAATTGAAVTIISVAPAAERRVAALALVAVVTAVVLLIHLVVLVAGRDPLARSLVARVLSIRQIRCVFS